MATSIASPGYQPSREQFLPGDLHANIVIIARSRILTVLAYMEGTRLYRKWKGCLEVSPWDSQRCPPQEIREQYVPISFVKIQEAAWYDSLLPQALGPQFVA